MSDDRPQQLHGKSDSPIDCPQDPESHSEQAKRLIEVMGRNLVIALAIGSVIGAIILCLIGMFWSHLITTQVSRFFLCLLTAFLFSVFVFTLFPADFRLDVSKITSMASNLVGPPALWIILFLVFWKMLPAEDIVGKLFVPALDTNQVAYSTSWVLHWDPSPPQKYYKVKLSPEVNSSDPNLPAGFYIEFDKAHAKYTALIGIGPSSEEIKARYKLVFTRSASTYNPEVISETEGERK